MLGAGGDSERVRGEAGKLAESLAIAAVREGGLLDSGAICLRRTWGWIRGLFMRWIK